MGHPDQAESLQAVAALFARYRRPWWFCGGWAIDLFAGRVRRPHWDVDVLILMPDLAHFSEVFAGSTLAMEDHVTGGKRPWTYPIPLTPGRNTLYFNDDTIAPYSLEILIGLSDGDDWVFHRSNRIRMPLERLTHLSPAGLPFVAPEVVLMTKARGNRRKDDRDFQDTADLLGTRQRSWLLNNLPPTDSDDHPWQARLEQHGEVT